jgi:uncharacterized protein YegL
VSNRPGGELARRPLHFIWICDCSSSMEGDKIETLNYAIREALPLMRDVAEQNPNAQLLLRALKFSSGAQWHVGTPTPVDDFRWSERELTASGVTDMGRALTMLADQLRVPPMTDRALPPVLVLLTDGQPTDDFESGLRKLMAEPWGTKAVRVAIAIGGDANRPLLQKFMGHSELKPIEANNPEALIQAIRWVSTVVLTQASSPSSQAADTEVQLGNVAVPTPPVTVPTSAGDVW